MSIWEIILPILWAGGLLGVGFVFSRRFEGRFHPDYFFPSAGLLGLIIYGLGLCGALYESIFIVITLVFALFFIWMLIQVREDLYDFINNKTIYFILILPPLIWYSLASLSYPITIDALYIHLGVPKIFAASGKIFYIPANLFSAAPLTSEMISTGFYALGLERGAQLFIVFVVAILALSIWNRAREFESSGVIALLILFTIPMLMGLITGSKNDYLLWGLTFFSTIRFLHFDRSGKTSFLILSAIGAGMAAGTKAIGLALIGPLGLIIAYNIVLGKYRLIHLFYFTVLFFVIASPWYCYSWIVAGNPVYPFFDNFFHSPYSSPQFNSFNDALAIHQIDKSILNFIITPIKLIFDPQAYDGRLGYGIILFPALLLFVRQIPQSLKTALGISLIFYCIWFFGFSFARFLLPIAPILAIAGSYFFKIAMQGGKPVKYAAIAALGLGVILPLPSVIRDTMPRVKSVISATPKYEFLENYQTLDSYQTQSIANYKGLPYIKCWHYLNDNTPYNSKIGILASFWTRPDGYYLDRDFLYLNPSEQNIYNFTSLLTDDSIGSSLGKLGITYIVLDSVILDQFSDNSPWKKIDGFPLFSAGVNALVEFCQRNGELAYSDNRYRVYKIKDPPASIVTGGFIR